MLTPERLRELIDYDPATGIFVWKRRPLTISGAASWNLQYAGKAAGYVNMKPRTSYLMISVGDRPYRAHRLAWLYVYGEWPPSEIDHIDNDGMNNAIENLRLADATGNKRNRRVRLDSASGVKGVRWREDGQNWSAEIKAHGRRHWLGRFDSIEAASAAYDAAALRLHGEFARINQDPDTHVGR